jgi:hypothetical protein
MDVLATDLWLRLAVVDVVRRHTRGAGLDVVVTHDAAGFKCQFGYNQAGNI